MSTVRCDMMKRVLGLVLAGSLLAACGASNKSSTNGTTTAQKASPGGPEPIDTTPFNK
jgi:ABC-type glycerol-3-phosphate transport system substrate-binding protein